MTVRRCAAPDFRLDATLASGQVFRWQPADGAFLGVIDGHLVRLRQDDHELLYECSAPELTPERLSAYFSLDHDLDRMLSTVDCDEHVHAAVASLRGLRLIRQDPWECTATYLLTSFNNIQRIMRMIENLCQHFGQPVTLHGWRAFTFPRPEAIADVPVGRLGLLGFGFRAAPLLAVARRFADRSFRPDDLRDRPYPVVKERLMELPGIGDKVADCIALFAFQRYEAFPIDLWIRRALALYLPKDQLTLKRMHTFAATHFGPYAGYAQQYLYHWLRSQSEQEQFTSAHLQRRMYSRLLLHQPPTDAAHSAGENVLTSDQTAGNA